MNLSGFGLTEFDGAVHAQQDVVTLNVSVDHLAGVEELQRLQTLKRKIQHICQTVIKTQP